MPWKAFPWMGSRPLGLLASTVGWVAAFWIERLEMALEDPGPFVQVLLAIVLRVAFVYLWLLGAATKAEINGRTIVARTELGIGT